MEKFIRRSWPVLASMVAMIAILTSCVKEVDEVASCEFPQDEELKLVWNDEFDQPSIDSEKWSYEIGDGCQYGPDLCGWGNNELQYYTSRPENSSIEDGKLVITAREESYEGSNFTSARMVTKNKGDWRYGRVDVRAKLPRGQGIWPAIWMLSTDTAYGIWPASGEIDIMEAIGSDTAQVFSTIHYGHDFWRFDTQYFSYPPEDSVYFSADFHVYTVLWTENCIQFQVDGRNVGVPNTRSTVYPTTWPFDQPFHLILNVAVGGNLPGNPDGTTTFPQRFEIDYVRVYQEN